MSIYCMQKPQTLYFAYIENRSLIVTLSALTVAAAGAREEAVDSLDPLPLHDHVQHRAAPQRRLWSLLVAGPLASAVYLPHARAT